MNQEKKTNYLVPFIIITTLFFIFGFVTSLNGILMPYLKEPANSVISFLHLSHLHFLVPILFFQFPRDTSLIKLDIKMESYLAY